MNFRLQRIAGKRRQKFLDRLRVDELTARDLIKELPDPLPLLYVEDFGTVGLGGIDRADHPRVADQ